MKKTMRAAIAALAVLVAAAAGVFAYGRYDAKQNQLPVLMYHHLVEDGQECNDMTVTVSRMEEDFRWLSQHGYTPVLPRELAQEGFQLPDKPVLITFDDGYRSNYELLYPLVQKYRMKVIISIMVYMQDHDINQFLSWDMCREMQDSGLVEFGSHAYDLHNLDIGGTTRPDGIDGIERRPGESDADFDQRVLEDIRKSSRLIEEALGEKPVCFAYPFGVGEPDAEEVIHELFPVTLMTKPAMADLRKGLRDLPRFTVTMNKPLDTILAA